MDLLNRLGKTCAKRSHLVERRRRGDPEAFPAISPLIDLLSLGIAEQLVAFNGRNSFFCLDFATRKFLYGRLEDGRFHREPATRCRFKPMRRRKFWDQIRTYSF